MSGIEKLQFDNAQILYILDLGLDTIFFMKILFILPDFHEKTLSRPGDIIISNREENVHIHSYPIYGPNFK